MTDTGWSPTRTPFDASTSNKPTEKVHRPLAPSFFVVVLAPDPNLSAISPKVRPKFDHGRGPFSRSRWPPTPTFVLTFRRISPISRGYV